MSIIYKLDFNNRTYIRRFFTEDNMGVRGLVVLFIVSAILVCCESGFGKFRIL